MHPQLRILRPQLTQFGPLGLGQPSIHPQATSRAFQTQFPERALVYARVSGDLSDGLS